jgi:hypothetical protein
MGQASGEPAGPEALMAAEAVQGRVCFLKQCRFIIKDSSQQQASAVILLILFGCLLGSSDHARLRRMRFLHCRPEKAGRDLIGRSRTVPQSFHQSGAARVR